MRRSTVVTLAVALVVLVGACSPAAPDPSGSAVAGSLTGPASPGVVAASANPCVEPIAHLAAFANRLNAQLVELRPLVTATEFDSSTTAAGIRGVSGTLTSYDGLEARLASCPATAPIAEAVGTLRSDARASIEASNKASIRDQIVQRAVAAALFGLLPAVEAIATATRDAARIAGIDTDVAVVPDASAQPIGSLPPLATSTPRPTPPTGDIATIDSAFFGPNTVVQTYRIAGRTPLDLVASIRAHGPRNDWLPGRAEAQTLAIPHVRIGVSGQGSSCRVVSQAKPAVSFSFEITLPRWDPPSGAANSTITWWNAELRRAATHENHHVDLWRSAGAQMTKAAATSTCSNLQAHLSTIVKQTTRENCEFDMAEYGAALGLSLEDCVSR